jgi:hypothetical protein
MIIYDTQMTIDAPVKIDALRLKARIPFLLASVWKMAF